MNDPYKILGVSQQASDEEIRTAYVKLAKKYHPDGYVDNPLADLASEKMQEINLAYDEIMLARKNKSSGANGSTAYSAGQFADIRKLINNKRITEAEELLDGVPQEMRDAEWFFLKGNIFYLRGWLEEAYQHFYKACSMDPRNLEYKAAFDRMSWQRQTGSPNYGRRKHENTVCGMSLCDFCTALYCADCCCECMGGNFLRCC